MQQISVTTSEARERWLAIVAALVTSGITPDAVTFAALMMYEKGKVDYWDFVDKKAINIPEGYYVDLTNEIEKGGSSNVSLLRVDGKARTTKPSGGTSSGNRTSRKPSRMNANWSASAERRSGTPVTRKPTWIGNPASDH
jgi:hypothetical protein